MKGFVVGLCVVLACVAAAGAARAHVAQVSSSHVERTGDRTFIAGIEVNARDLEAALGVDLLSEDGSTIAPEALEQAAAPIAAYLTEHAAVTTASGAFCSADPEAPQADGVHVRLSVTWQCPPAEEGLVYRADPFVEHDETARHIVVLVEDGERGQALLYGANRTVALGAAETMALSDVVYRYVYSGIEHIFIGYDHIAFLIAVILWGRRAWPLVKVVTAFTIGHSITLSLAVLEIVTLPGTLVEALIAASIVYVAAENFFVRSIDRRWLITGFLGLVHGFGFASVLRDYGLPEEALATALAAFNIGVEIGQVAIVLLAVPILMLADRLIESRAEVRTRHPAVVYPVSACIMALGLYWLAERTLLA